MKRTERTAATIISYLFHPLLMPVLGFLLMMHSGTYLSGLDSRIVNFLLVIVFGLTLFLPATLIPLYIYSKIIKNAHMDEKRERVVPFYITLVFYLLAFLLIRNVPVSTLYAKFMLSACLTLVVVSAITLFWKISAHLAALGGMVALILGVSLLLNADLTFFLTLSILISGITAYARLRLDAHTPLQVLCGFMVGFGSVLFILLI